MQTQEAASEGRSACLRVSTFQLQARSRVACAETCFLRSPKCNEDINAHKSKDGSFHLKCLRKAMRKSMRSSGLFFAALCTLLTVRRQSNSFEAYSWLVKWVDSQRDILPRWHVSRSSGANCQPSLASAENRARLRSETICICTLRRVLSVREPVAESELSTVKAVRKSFFVVPIAFSFRFCTQKRSFVLLVFSRFRPTSFAVSLH